MNAQTKAEKIREALEDLGGEATARRLSNEINYTPKQIGGVLPNLDGTEVVDELEHGKVWGLAP